MIINDLIDQYEVLEKLDEVPYFGWARAKVPYALEINEDGELQRIVILGDTSKKKPRNEVFMPATGTGRSGTSPNPLFVWDNAEYLLGNPSGSNEERAAERFAASAELHERLLKNVHDATGKAIKAFFKRPPQWEKAAQQFGTDWEKIARSYFTFMVDGRLAKDDPEIRSAWDDRPSDRPIDESAMRESFTSGKLVVPAATHPVIKEERFPPTGALLISFNGNAFESFGQKQGSNAPLSEEDAFKYGAALNALLADRDRVSHLDNVTVVTWPQTGGTTYSDVMDVAGFGNLLPIADEVKDKKPVLDSRGQMLLEQIESAVKALAQGKTFDVDEITLYPSEHFFILGLVPNKARLSVVFYLRDNFGSFMKNIEQHYSDMDIVRPKSDATRHMSIYRILRQTVRPNSKNAASASGPNSTQNLPLRKKQQRKNAASSPELGSALIKSILQGTPYPAALLNNVEMRIRAERDVSSDKAAIIKAYYLRLSRRGPIIINDETANQKFKEVLQVGINEDSDYVPYVLGRMFSVYEQIQQAAASTSSNNNTIKATIKDKYFSQAAATPARVFPVIGARVEKRMRQLMRDKPGLAIYLQRKLDDIAAKLPDRYPKHLTLDEQGAFQLGYYHQHQAAFEGKNKVGESAERHDES
ncbi:type I-C CRISPR-associated protein Cas8c/Csd1 [Bifidobacterium animalis]|uniref:type I-C CRISPR-associated protein Cas8c/Csd1 n=1 Tax=Bifidobacterium animalis TaxID=28025 RepID=UPI003F8D9D94